MVSGLRDAAQQVKPVSDQPENAAQRVSFIQSLSQYETKHSQAVSN
jgi:hypothetical protein